MTEDPAQPGARDAGAGPPADAGGSRLSPGRIGIACLCCLLFALVFETFRPALHYDFVKYDDPEYVTDNPHVQGGLTWEGLKWAFGSTAATNWHPLTWVSHMLDCQWYGLAPRGHHLTSILLHSANAVLLFLVLRRMTGTTWRSLIVAAFFGLHPLRIESVVWVSERKDVLSAAFWMLTLWAYAAYAAASRVQRSKATLCYILALLAFGMGLLGKPMVVTLPFVLLLLDYWPLDRVRAGPLRGLLLEKVPFFLLAAASSCVTFEVQKRWGAVSDAHPFSDRLGNAAVSYCRYLWMLVHPVDLACFYPHVDHWGLGAVLSAFGLLAAVTLAAVALGRRQRYLPVGWLWFLGTLVPVIGLVQVGEQALADRYTYLPSVGIGIAAVWGAHALAGRRSGGRVALVLAAVVLAALCVVSTRRQMVCWRDSEALFRHALAVTRDNYVMRGNLGTTLSAEGRLDESVAQYREAIRIRPDGADAHVNLGAAFEKLGLRPEAIQEFVTAIRLNPGLPAAHFNLANTLAESGQPDAAIAEYETALRIRPGFTNAMYNLGNTLSASGRLDEAIAQYEHYLKIDPRCAEVHFNLGVALSRQGRLDAALAEFEAALKGRPDLAEAHAAEGAILERQGRLDEAVAEFRQALKLRPDDATARRDLEEAMALQRKTAAPPE